MLLEVACFSLEDALVAQAAEAHRIELCVDYNAGGVIPPHGMIWQARQKISIPLFLMVRPRPGNFIYTAEEITLMQAQILEAKRAKYDGVVFGVLNEKTEINTHICGQLVALSHPLACTFHRAFDETLDLQQSLESIIACGFQRVLTAGGKGNAAENLSALKQLREQAADRIIIMPGGGVRSSNIHEILAVTGCTEIHTAAWDKRSGSLDPEEVQNLIRQ